MVQLKPRVFLLLWKHQGKIGFLNQRDERQHCKQRKKKNVRSWLYFRYLLTLFTLINPRVVACGMGCPGRELVQSLPLRCWRKDRMWHNKVLFSHRMDTMVSEDFSNVADSVILSQLHVLPFSGTTILLLLPGKKASVGKEI